jgi:hypothetical protein
MLPGPASTTLMVFRMHLQRKMEQDGLSFAAQQASQTRDLQEPPGHAWIVSAAPATPTAATTSIANTSQVRFRMCIPFAIRRRNTGSVRRHPQASRAIAAVRRRITARDVRDDR